MLKKLQSDRRVDKGAKWSPVFGRYGFWMGKGKEKEAVWSVGDKVKVTKVNTERTVWSKLFFLTLCAASSGKMLTCFLIIGWPGLG